MNAQQYNEAIAKLGLHQVSAGRFLEISTRTSNRYATGALPVPPLITVLLRLMLQLDLKPADVERYKKP